MAFYDRLEQMERRGATAAHLVAVFGEKLQQVTGEIPASMNNLQTLSEIDLPGIGVRGTPTVLLVDSNGTVRRIWRGMLSPDTERQVLLAIQADRSVDRASPISSSRPEVRKPAKAAGDCCSLSP